MPLDPSSESNAVLDRLIDRSQRKTGVQLPRAFARRSDGDTTLASLIQGGRGGDVRLKLYLSIVLLAGSKHKHKVHGKNTVVNVSGASWARALALPDPTGAGARRVADAQDQLAQRDLILVERRPGQAPKVTLRNALGTDRRWVEPSYPYVRIPLEIWANRWIWYLSAKELAIYVAIRDLCGGDGRDGTGGPQALTGNQMREYGMSADTWRIASASLESDGLIRTESRVIGFDLDSPRRRKRYQLVDDGLSMDPRAFSGQTQRATSERLQDELESSAGSLASPAGKGGRGRR